jgi:hypothetical protein
MAGYGNRTAPEYTVDETDTTRLGLTESHDAYSNAHPKYGSGATGGAGFGASTFFSPITYINQNRLSCILIHIADGINKATNPTPLPKTPQTKYALAYTKILHRIVVLRG